MIKESRAGKWYTWIYFLHEFLLNATFPRAPEGVSQPCLCPPFSVHGNLHPKLPKPSALREPQGNWVPKEVERKFSAHFSLHYVPVWVPSLTKSLTKKTSVLTSNLFLQKGIKPTRHDRRRQGGRRVCWFQGLTPRLWAYPMVAHKKQPSWPPNEILKPYSHFHSS